MVRADQKIIATSIAGCVRGRPRRDQPSNSKQSVATPGERTGDMIIAALATIYIVSLVFAAAPDFLLLGFLAYAPGSILYYMTRREQPEAALHAGRDRVVVVSVVGAIAAVVGLMHSYITI